MVEIVRSMFVLERLGGKRKSSSCSEFGNESRAEKVLRKFLFLLKGAVSSRGYLARASEGV